MLCGIKGGHISYVRRSSSNTVLVYHYHHTLFRLYSSCLNLTRELHHNTSTYALLCTCSYITTTQQDYLFFYFCRKKLTPDQIKEWSTRLIGYANYVNIVDDIVVLVHQIVLEKAKTNTAVKIVLATLDSVSVGLRGVYDEFKVGYDEVQKGSAPDFEAPIPFPPPPPSIPDKGGAVSWFQLGWSIVRSALNAVALKFSKLELILGPLDKAGDELVKQLNKYFGQAALFEFPAEPTSKQEFEADYITYGIKPPVNK